MVVGLIPWTAMMAWAAFEQLDEGATAVLIAALRHVDEHEMRKRARTAPAPRGRK